MIKLIGIYGALILLATILLFLGNIGNNIILTNNNFGTILSLSMAGISLEFIQKKINLVGLKRKEER